MMGERHYVVLSVILVPFQSYFIDIRAQEELGLVTVFLAGELGSNNF